MSKPNYAKKIEKMQNDIKKMLEKRSEKKRLDLFQPNFPTTLHVEERNNYVQINGGLITIEEALEYFK